ncbi:MAG: HAMP domain-containing histidine kinase [Rhodobacterales bacterium]|nr:HAMP domain-containing histidine kinase [Rhodobacterales bacterium]
MFFLKGLSGRLLILTILFVMLAELLIWAPSISRFRKSYLEDRIAKGQIATLALEATPDYMVSRDLEDRLLYHAEVYAVAVNTHERRVLALSKTMPPAVDVTFDLRETMFPTWIGDAVSALLRTDNRVMRVIGYSAKDPGVAIEVVLDEAPMRKAMLAFSTRILQLSIAISLFTAGLVYFSLQWLLVRPMRRITRSMVRFRENPEDESRAIHPSDRSDEIGVAQRELAEMQREIRVALKQKDRLAAVGAAVSKINHDLRNTLATAMLVSDRLADIDDPEVKRVTPRLFDAMDKAVNLCSRTLNYVADTSPKMHRARFALRDLVADVGGTLPPMDGRPFAWDNRVDRAFLVEADRDELFRVFSNLGRNAREAGAARVTIESEERHGRLSVTVADNGPGLPDKARERLFQPFAGSVRRGGTGLGLVIARDILRAHRGDITLLETGPDGTTFRLDLPLME